MNSQNSRGDEVAISHRYNCGIQRPTLCTQEVFLFFKAARLIYQEDAKKHLSALQTRYFNSHMSMEEDIALIKAKSGFAIGGVCQIMPNIGQVSSRRNVW